MTLWLAALALQLTTAATPTDVAPAAAAPTDVYGVHLGVNLPPEGTTLRPLSYADDDAARFHMFTSSFARQSWLLSVFDDRTRRRHAAALDGLLAPTAASLDRVMDELGSAIAASRQAGRRVEVWFTYSGHGVQQAGGTGLALLDGSLGRGFLSDRLAKLDADEVHLFIDACHAQGLVEGRGLNERSTTGRALTDDESAVFAQTFFDRHPHVGAVLASSAEQETHEWSRLEAGVFTHEVLSGLYGPADVNGDGAVAYSELAAFVASANRALDDPRAAPTVITHPPALRPGAVLLDEGWLESWARLQSPPAAWGHFWVERADGLRLLDAHVDPSLPISVAVPAGQELFVRHDGGEVRVLAARREVVSLGRLTLTPPRSVARGSVAKALHEGLFRSPYSRAYYDGFVDSQRLMPVAPRTAASANAASLSTSSASGDDFDDLYDEVETPAPRVAAAPAERAASAQEDTAGVPDPRPRRRAAGAGVTAIDEVPEDSVLGWVTVGLAAGALGAVALTGLSAAGMWISYQQFQATDLQAPAAMAADGFYLSQAGLFLGVSAVVVLGSSAAATGVWWALE